MIGKTAASAGLALLALFAWAGTAAAQLDVKWSCATPKLLLFEPAKASVTVVNHAGVPLDFGPGGNAELSFEIEDAEHVRIAPTGRPVVTQTNTVAEDEGTLTLRVDLFSSYRLVREQHYRVTPHIRFAGTTFTAETKNIEIQPGIELVKRDYGMPDTREGRTVTLRMLNRNRELHLFLRIDSRDGYCLAVHDLGSFLRSMAPRLERDAAGNFHVLHQTMPQQFVHSVHRADGRRESVMYYQGEASTVRLARGPGGTVEVTGGMAFLPAAVKAGYPDTGSRAVTDFSIDLPKRDPDTGKFKPWWRKNRESE